MLMILLGDARCGKQSRGGKCCSCIFKTRLLDCWCRHQVRDFEFFVVNNNNNNDDNNTDNNFINMSFILVLVSNALAKCKKQPIS